jgi:hypothetical protein
MNALFKPPGDHLGGEAPTRARTRRDLDRAAAHPWHVLLWGGVDLVTECEAFVSMLILAGRVRVMVTEDARGRIEVIP